MLSLVTVTVVISAAQAASSPEHQPYPLVLWSEGSGGVVLSSATHPIRALYGSQSSNVSGEVVGPPIHTLCVGASETWRGRIVLADDWIAPGCSMEQRARNIERSGALAVVFKGTEGVVFDWDGSDISKVRLAVIILSYKVYGDLAQAVDLHERNATWSTDFLRLWLQPVMSPLVHNPIFNGVDRTMQAIFFFAVGLALLFAGVQLYRFSRHPGNTAAKRVIFLELLSLVSMLIFVVDGPCQEHTRTVLMPWAFDIMSQRLQLDLHILASLVFASHLRLIRSKVENPSLHDSMRRFSRHLSIKSFGRKGSSTVSSPGTAAIVVANEHTPKPPIVPSWLFARLFILMGVVMIIADLILGVLIASYLASSPFDMLAYLYVSLVMLVIGIWFFAQARIVLRGLRAAAHTHNRGSGRDAAHKRLSRNAMRVGVSKIIAIALGIGGEFLRQDLLNKGGWLYWWTMLPIWYLLQAALLASSIFQIVAFQPPSNRAERKASGARRQNDPTRAASKQARNSTAKAGGVAPEPSPGAAVCTLSTMGTRLSFEVSTIREEPGGLRGSGMSSLADSAEGSMGASC